MTITRSIILDLWPAYAAGEASQDTRALVDAFLRDDPEFGRQLRQDPLGPLDAPMPAPDLEMRAFGRIVSDTSFDVSPRPFIIVAGIGVAFWIAFFVSLWRMRSRILIVPTAPKTRG
jgi:hypothetical protein